MLKYLAAVALAVTTPSTPATAPTIDPVPTAPGVAIVPITVDFVTKSKNETYRVALHHGRAAFEALIGGCPAPVNNTPFYLIGMPTVGTFMVNKALLDSTLKLAKGDFLTAGLALLETHQMCVVIDAKPARIV